MPRPTAERARPVPRTPPALALVLGAAAAFAAVSCGTPAEPAMTEGTVPVVATTSTATSPTSAAPAASTSTTVVAVRPRYAFPIRPAGAAAFSDEHHDYPAADIFAEAGTTVVAATDGAVDEVSREDRWDPATDDPSARGGLFVSIVGDDGIRYYASHLGSIEPGIEAGARVVAGEAIGTVGNSGNAATTPSHVHFGISLPTTPGDWEARRGQVWPQPYLRAWLDGENLTPVLRGA